MDKGFTSLTDTQQGIIFLAVGIFGFFFSLGWLGWFFNLIMIALSLAAILYGLLLTRIPQRTLELINRISKK